MNATPLTSQLLWIEADPLSGGSRSQVEFPAELSEFFNLPNNPNIGDEVQKGVIYNGINYPLKKMDFHHNDVWRWNLPTENQGIGNYDGSILEFTKSNDPNRFNLRILDLNSPDFATIRAVSDTTGHIGYRLRNDGSRREYGYY